MKALFIFTAILFLPSCVLCFEFYRDFCMPAAAAAYSDNPIKCLKSIKQHNSQNLSDAKFSVYRQYTIKNDLFNDTISAYTGVQGSTSSNTGYIILAFRGTTNFEQLFEDGWNYDEMVPFISGGNVNQQIFNAFNDIWIKSGMKDDVNRLKNKYPYHYFAVVGHSIGGAMASLAAATIASTGMKPAYFIWHVTFGQPRVGDKDFADAFNALHINSIRIIHNKDFLSHYPPLNETVYYHHVTEIWYPNNMGINDTYIFCDFDGEESKCSDSVNDSDTFGIDDHKFYYNHDIKEYGINGCSDPI